MIANVLRQHYMAAVTTYYNMTGSYTPGGQAWVPYQPASRYRAFQGIETGIYVLLAAALIAVTFAIVRRRDA